MDIRQSIAVTVQNAIISGEKAHASFTTRRSYGLLFKDCEDKTGMHHGPGFEVSDYRSLWDWNGLSSSGAPTPPDGGRGAKFGSNDWLAQTLQVDPDEFYTIKFWFVTKKTELPIGVKFLITDADNPSNIILDTSTGPSASSGEYEEISFLFETGSASNITVRLDYGDGETRIDLFSIE
jgi:hypothetical protein